jgi:hypothetical protein
MTRPALTLAIIAICATVIGCEAKVTLDNYDQIQVGMAQHQVEAILGEGTRESAAGMGIDASGFASRDSEDNSRATYLWEEDGRQIVIDFEDQKVKSKRKSGF